MNAVHSLAEPLNVFTEESERLALLGTLYVQAQLRERAEARERKDFAKADAIRAVLSAFGVVIEDSPQGVRWWVNINEAGRKSFSAWLHSQWEQSLQQDAENVPYGAAVGRAILRAVRHGEFDQTIEMLHDLKVHPAPTRIVEMGTSWDPKEGWLLGQKRPPMLQQWDKEKAEWVPVNHTWNPDKGIYEPAEGERA